MNMSFNPRIKIKEYLKEVRGILSTLDIPWTKSMENMIKVENEIQYKPERGDGGHDLSGKFGAPGKSPPPPYPRFINISN